MRSDDISDQQHKEWNRYRHPTSTPLSKDAIVEMCYTDEVYASQFRIFWAGFQRGEKVPRSKEQVEMISTAIDILTREVRLLERKAQAAATLGLRELSAEMFSVVDVFQAQLEVVRYQLSTFSSSEKR